jgi:hypothetical protein
MYVQFDVDGVTNEDVPELELELSKICGAPAEREETLGDLGSVISFVAELSNNPTVAAALLVALVRLRHLQIKVTKHGVTVTMDAGTSEKDAERILSSD